MLRPLVTCGRWTFICFNPHRARRPGATCGSTAADWHRHPKFQSSPGPEARCYAAPLFTVPPGSTGFNPHRARRPGATCCSWLIPPNAWVVSILTGPGGPVLPVIVHCLFGRGNDVSILTGPGGPVLPGQQA